MYMYISAAFAIGNIQTKYISKSIKWGERHRKRPWIPGTMWEEGGTLQRVRDRDSRMAKEKNKKAKYIGPKKWKIIC